MTLTLRNLTMPLILTLALALGGCGSAEKKEIDDGSAEMTMDKDSGDNQGLDLELNTDSDSGEAGPLDTIHFPFDSSRLTAEAREKLQENVDFLKENSNVELEIEGHADERGGVQYNLALGESRAKSVKDYMEAMGIDSDRLSTISFGKERPIAFGHNEEAWSQNRRANFVITSK